MKKALLTWLAVGFILSFFLDLPRQSLGDSAFLGGGTGTIQTLDQFTSTSSPSTAITQRAYGKVLRLSGYGTGCAEFSSNGTISSTGVACGGTNTLSYDWQQVTNTFGVNSLTPTSTIPLNIQSTASSTFRGGLESWTLISAPYFNATSTATSTFVGGLKLAGLSSTNGLTVTGTGTSTFSSGLNLSSGCFSINNACVGGAGGAGTVTSIVAGSGLSGGTITTSGTISLSLQFAPLSVGYLVASSTATSTFASSVYASFFGAPYFNATSTTATSTFTGGVLLANGAGNVGIGTTTPKSLLQLFVNLGTTTASVDGNSATKGGCLEVKDLTGGGYTYITTYQGQIITDTVSCK